MLKLQIPEAKQLPLKGEIWIPCTLIIHRKDKFVSRACGYIANYENLSSDLKMETDNWIKDIEIVTPLVENSTAAHVKIFH